MADHVSPATSPTQGSSRSESSSLTSVMMMMMMTTMMMAMMVMMMMAMMMMMSRSESSSPTSVRPRARASSADDSSKKEIRQNRDKGERKETIEDWEIPIDDIFIGPRIGAGSFGQFSHIRTFQA